jgi:UDP-glucose:(heptosyl)LPS alpha-1,3-glucosyltransferase
MRTFRFATAIRNFSSKKGGAERYLVDLCHWMARGGIEVHVYAEGWDGVTGDIHLHRIQTISFPRSLRLLSFARRATREIETGSYDLSLGVGNTLRTDILQPHGGVHWAWFWRSLRAYTPWFLWNVRLLGRALSVKQWVSGYIEDAPYKAKRRPRIIAISDMVRQDIIRWYRIPSDEIAVVYNGVNVNRFHPGNRRYRGEVRTRHGIGEESLFLFVSNNFRMKGLGFLIRALADLKEKKATERSFRLLILGRDRPGPYLRLARGLGVSEEVIFAGRVEEPEKYYGAADLLLHPTFYDACSLTVLEAAATGLPVITTVFNGASGVLDPGRNWILSDPGDISQLRSAILDFLIKKEAGLLVPPAEERADHLSEEKNFDRMLVIFEETLQRKRTNAANRKSEYYE